MANDSAFSDFPEVTFQNGLFSNLEFEFTSLDRQLTILLGGSGTEFYFAQGPFGSEIEKFNGNVVNVVPIPAAVWLFGTALVALLGIGAQRCNTL